MYAYNANSDEQTKLLEIAIRVSTDQLKIPMLGQFLMHPYVENPERGGTRLYNRFSPLDATSGVMTASNTPKKFYALALICASEQNHFGKEEACQKSVYDFNKDVWSQVEFIRSMVSNCKHIVTYPQYRQNAALPEEKLVQDHEDDTLDEDDPDTLDTNFILIKKRHKKQKQQYSESCGFGFRCRLGTNCKFGHSTDEKSYFKEHPQAKRHLYKTQLCTRILKGTCKYSRNSYMCSFAHNFEEYFCLSCGEIGQHFADECPKKHILQTWEK